MGGCGGSLSTSVAVMVKEGGCKSVSLDPKNHWSC